MRKEFFDQHFHGRSFTNSLNYYLSTLFFNCFPIPQREPGALATLRYIGELSNDRWCLLIFPEGIMVIDRRDRAFPTGRRDDRSQARTFPWFPSAFAGMDRVLQPGMEDGAARAGRYRVRGRRFIWKATTTWRWPGEWRMRSESCDHSLGP